MLCMDQGATAYSTCFGGMTPDKQFVVLTGITCSYEEDQVLHVLTKKTGLWAMKGSPKHVTTDRYCMHQI